MRNLVDPNGEYYPDMDWQDIYPWWVLIEDDVKAVACAQIVASKPIGHVEFLNIDPSLSDIQRASAVKTMEQYAHVALYSSGVTVARSSIPHDMKFWKKAVKRHWGTFQFGASVFDMRIH